MTRKWESGRRSEPMLHDIEPVPARSDAGRVEVTDSYLVGVFDEAAGDERARLEDEGEWGHSPHQPLTNLQIESRYKTKLAGIRAVRQALAAAPPSAPVGGDEGRLSGHIRYDIEAHNNFTLALRNLTARVDELADVVNQHDMSTDLMQGKCICGALETCDCGKPTPAPDDAPGSGEGDEDETLCEVCQRPVMWGSRHVSCGEYVMNLEKRLGWERGGAVTGQLLREVENMIWSGPWKGSSAEAMHLAETIIDHIAAAWRQAEGVEK